MTSSISIAKVSAEMVGNKHLLHGKFMKKGLKGKINNALYLAHHDAYLHINHDTKKCRFFSVINNFLS